MLLSVHTCTGYVTQKEVALAYGRYTALRAEHLRFRISPVSKQLVRECPFHSAGGLRDECRQPSNNGAISDWLCYGLDGPGIKSR